MVTRCAFMCIRTCKHITCILYETYAYTHRTYGGIYIGVCTIAQSCAHVLILYTLQVLALTGAPIYMQIEAWISEKMQVATDESYKDPTNLEGKLQKHQKFEAEITPNEQRIHAIAQVRLL